MMDAVKKGIPTKERPRNIGYLILAGSAVVCFVFCVVIAILLATSAQENKAERVQLRSQLKDYRMHREPNEQARLETLKDDIQHRTQRIHSERFLARGTVFLDVGLLVFGASLLGARFMRSAAIKHVVLQ